MRTWRFGLLRTVSCYCGPNWSDCSLGAPTCGLSERRETAPIVAECDPVHLSRGKPGDVASERDEEGPLATIPPEHPAGTCSGPPSIHCHLVEPPKSLQTAYAQNTVGHPYLESH